MTPEELKQMLLAGMLSGAGIGDAEAGGQTIYEQYTGKPSPEQHKNPSYGGSWKAHEQSMENLFSNFLNFHEVDFNDPQLKRKLEDIDEKQRTGYYPGLKDMPTFSKASYWLNDKKQLARLLKMRPRESED